MKKKKRKSPLHKVPKALAQAADLHSGSGPHKNKKTYRRKKMETLDIIATEKYSAEK